MTTAIRVTSLCKRFRENIALENLTLDFPARAISALVGPDGAGKTTLLRILAGILDYEDGQVRMSGEGLEAKRVAIGYMPQRFGLYEDLTVQENIDFFADLFGVLGAARQERVKRLLEFSRMEPFTKRLTGQLSGGMKQKLGLACALIHSPRIILLDEPTNGVDPVSRREFWKLLHDLNRSGTTVIISSPYMDEAERAGFFALMSKGKLIAHGVPAEERRNSRYTVYELPTAQARAVKEQLCKRSEFRSVNLFGKSVHIATENVMTLDNVRTVLASEQIDSTKLKAIVPTFEDIYIGLSAE